MLDKVDLQKHKYLSANLTGEHDKRAMIVEELLNSKNQLENGAELLSKDVRMITNLQNIKNSLKKTHSDNQILNFIKDFEFVDKLIEEHLQSKASDPKNAPKFLPRDPKSFRKFLMNLDEVKNTYDPYTNFFIREAKEKEMTRKVLPERIKKATSKEEKEYYQEMLDSLLLAEYQTEVSPLNIGTHVIKRNVLNYDLETLLRDENNYNRDPELYSESLTDDFILEKKRREAESKLIKTKIIYKLHTELPLTKNEMAYLKEWNSQIRTSNFVDLDT